MMFLEHKKCLWYTYMVTKKSKLKEAFITLRVLGRTPPECMECLQSPKVWKTEIHSSEVFIM